MRVRSRRRRTPRLDLLAATSRIASSGMSNSAAKMLASRSTALASGSSVTSSARQKTGVLGSFQALADPMADLMGKREPSTAGHVVCVQNDQAVAG